MSKIIGLNVDYPIIKGNGSFFKQTFNTLDARKSNIHILFRTIPGERVMNPEFGIGIHRYLFENSTPELELQLQQEIITQINKYIPDINIDNLLVDFHYNDLQNMNNLSITLDFSIKNNPDLNSTIIEKF